MPYITMKQSPIHYQILFEDMIKGIDDLSKYIAPNKTNTRTYFTKSIRPSLKNAINVNRTVLILSNFVRNNEALYEKDRASLYQTFHIPKSSGGLRRIDAPCDELMDALRQLKTIFESFPVELYHTTAFAYIKGRCTVDAIKRHQQNQSKWFVKLDFSNFFGSTTPTFVLEMLSQIFPFSEIVSVTDGREVFTKALDLCFLNGGLPQGTPISPLITNLMMIPIDHTLSNTLRNFMDRQFVYTRYADDILASCKIDFNSDKVQQLVESTLNTFNAPFNINRSKTRYGSNAGRNWNLGLMLNKDNQITIGHKKKKQFKAMVDNYIHNKKDGVGWDKNDVQVLRGLISYYQMVEREYIDYIINQYSKKYNFDIWDSIKADLSL